MSSPIDIERELIDLSAQEEVLAFFDFTMPIGNGAGASEIEGLCKVSRPKERSSRSTYVSMMFIIDAQDADVHRAVDQHMREVDWDAYAVSTPGVECVLPVPHRSGSAGLFLKEVDVYLDGTQAPTAAFVSSVLQPAVARVVGLRPSEVTVWDDAPAAASKSAPAPEGDGSLLGRLRKLVGI